MEFNFCRFVHEDNIIEFDGRFSICSINSHNKGVISFSEFSLFSFEGNIKSIFSIIIIDGAKSLENKNIDWRYFKAFVLSWKSLNILISKYVIFLGLI